MSKVISVSNKFHKQLKDYKVHPRESFEDVIKRAIEGKINKKRGEKK